MKLNKEFEPIVNFMLDENIGKKSWSHFETIMDDTFEGNQTFYMNPRTKNEVVEMKMSSSFPPLILHCLGFIFPFWI